MGGDYKGWHNAHFKGIYTYGISPFYQKAFPNFFSQELPKAAKLFAIRLAQGAPFILTGYLIISWANQNHRERHRKGGADHHY